MGGLSELDRSIYEWQLDVPGFGEKGQEKLRKSTALVSRIGGLGGPLALQLAAAGIGNSYSRPHEKCGYWSCVCELGSGLGTTDTAASSDRGDLFSMRKVCKKAVPGASVACQ